MNENYEVDNVVNEVNPQDFEPVMAEVTNSNVNAGAVVGTLAGIGAAAVVVALIVRAVKKHKEKAELNQPAEGQVVEPTQEQLDEVTHK